MYQSPKRDSQFNVKEICRDFDLDLQRTLSAQASFDTIRVLDILYPLIDPKVVSFVRKLNKHEGSGFVHAITAISHRAGLHLDKIQSQTLFALDPVSKTIPDSDLPERSQQKKVFTNLSKPITLEDVEKLDIGFDPKFMLLLVNGALIDGISKPIIGKQYSVFQLLRHPFEEETIVLRGGSPVVQSQLVVGARPEGVRFNVNRNEEFTFAEKVLIFILEN